MDDEPPSIVIFPAAIVIVISRSVGGAGKRGGRGMVTVSVRGVERLKGVEMGGGFSIEKGGEVVQRET